MEKICITKLSIVPFMLLLLCVFFMACSGENDDEGIAPEISLNKEELVLEIGATERLVASFNPPETTNKAHIWSSSAVDIVSVDETGLVTALAIGEATITAKTLEGGKTASCHVKVEAEMIHVTGISLNYTEETLISGNQLQLRATVSPSNATDKTVKWMSSNEAVATVNSNGLVTAVAEGNTTITASSNDENKTASCQLKVKDKAPVFTGANFVPTDVYEDKLVLVSPMAEDVGEVNICFGTSPNPTVTSSDMTTAAVGDDGMLHLTLEGLKPATTYYIRSYSRTGITFEYYDDEVAVQTFGKDIQVEDQYVKYDAEWFDHVGWIHYMYAKIDYKLKGKGTYLVEGDNEGVLSPNPEFGRADSYSEVLYVEGGEGTFNCKMQGYLRNDGAIKYLIYSIKLIFTDLETSIRYHSPMLNKRIVVKTN